MSDKQMMPKQKSAAVKESQEEIIHQKHSLCRLINSFDRAFKIIDPYENYFPILYVNQKFTEMTGYKNADIVGAKQNILEGPGTDQNTSKKIEEIIQYECSGTIEILSYRKDGTSFWKELYLNPLYNEQKELLAYLSVQSDITEKKEVELEQEQKCSQLGQSAYKGWINFINPHGIIENVNKLSPSLRTNTQNINWHFTECLIDEDKEKHIQCFKSAMKGNVEYAKICVRPNEHNTIELDIIYIPSHANQEIDGVYIIYRNITGHNQTNALLNNAEKYHHSRKLASSITDAMQNPLMTLKGFLELSRLNPTASPEFGEIMLTEIERLELVTTGLSLISRPRILSSKKENLRLLLENVCTLMYTSALRSNVQISLSYKTKIEDVVCNKRNLEFAIVQLIRNSIEAMPSGGTISIEVITETMQSLLIRIIDNGKGIAEENVSKVKDSFYTTKNNRLGLGLRLADTIVIEHNGSLRITSEENKGTTVKVTLPISFS